MFYDDAPLHPEAESLIGGLPREMKRPRDEKTQRRRDPEMRRHRDEETQR